MTTYPAESFYRGTIRQSIANNTSVPFALKVSKIPTLTAWLLTISPNTANEEIVEYSGVDGTALTITIVKRWINPSSQVLTTNTLDYNNVSFMKNHSQNDSIRWDVNHIHISQMTWYFNLSENEITLWNNTHSWAEIFDKSIRFPVYADATARDAWIPSPTNGMVIYNTALWILQQYISWAWAAFASGTTTNADTTSSGKVEISTLTESRNWTDIWGTWAYLSVLPSQVSSYFGDGSDGDVTISTNTTLTRDMYYNNLTVNTAVTLNPAGYRIFVYWTTTLTGTAKIIRTWNNGSNSAAWDFWVWWGWWAALTTWTCWPNAAGSAWWTWGWPSSSAGTSVSPSYATTATTGAKWWNWWSGTSAGNGGTATQWTLYNATNSLMKILGNYMFPAQANVTINTTAYYGMPWSSGGGASAWSSGWGGGAGGNGWIIFIATNTIAGTWTIEAIWWNGGNGGNGTSYGWGGWAGGSGWIAIIVYRTGTPWTRTLTWGTGGTGGTGGSGAWTSGAIGTVWQSILINV